LKHHSPQNNGFFTAFDKNITLPKLPIIFTHLVDNQPHEICLLAIQLLQNHLSLDDKWNKYFDISHKINGPSIGKMFGIMVVKNQDMEIGYISAFSGKLDGENQHPYFVPPVYDSLTNDSFLTLGMLELKQINIQIETLNADKNDDYLEQIILLKIKRKENSILLQAKLFDQYNFLNAYCDSKNLNDIFHTFNNKNPPSGAGECAEPKLLQYAFQNKLKPIAIAEFWWGHSSNLRQHGHFYPSCKDKCGPILGFMLEGIDELEIRR
jgi:tRNA pseudouridine32 synthase/23S rRNA pseudouridine746 synthase